MIVCSTVGPNLADQHWLARETCFNALEQNQLIRVVVDQLPTINRRVSPEMVASRSKSFMPDLVVVYPATSALQGVDARPLPFAAALVQPG